MKSWAESENNNTKNGLCTMELYLQTFLRRKKWSLNLIFSWMIEIVLSILCFY